MLNILSSVVTDSDKGLVLIVEEEMKKDHFDAEAWKFEPNRTHADGF